MAEATFRIPSRTVQYGYVEIPFEFDSAPDAEMLAAHYVSYVHAFQKEEEATVERLKKGLSAPQGAAQSEVNRVIDETLKAAQILAEGLGGVTELHDPETEEVDPDPEAPWSKTVDTQPKPWETSEATGPGILDEAW